MNPLILLKYWKWIGVGLLVAALGVQTMRVEHAHTELAEVRQANAETLAKISDLATKTAEKAVAAMQAWNAALAGLDAKYSKERDDDLKDNETRRAAVARGDQRLRIAAVCPASRGDVPQAATAAGLDAQATVELSPAVGSSVFDLRAALIDDRAKLAGLQEYVAKVCPGAP